MAVDLPTLRLRTARAQAVVSEVLMSELSDANLRAILLAVIRRHGGVIDVSNTELYDAMLPVGGSAEFPFCVEETPSGIRLTLRDKGAGGQPI
jgi:hypothetical protein